MHIDSYGKCLNTASLPSDTDYEATHDNPVSPLVPLMRRYRFVFAFENSVQLDYVTEKFYIPLMAGAVPGMLVVEGEGHTYLITQTYLIDTNILDHFCKHIETQTFLITCAYIMRHKHT